ncbi:hypothetical protein ARMSODRAFT_974055 [Armillaria solidipes]|uniref:HAT C-terminal dimerisation domain-containing protein n=1 Tax=Armillaria solidipes TaxID=1076256 RepID=A0A2H3BPD9_9AGAR|nr:hypothetical protein ARMSODRAFT_974055 [Armillaria solidipes]
MSIHYIGYDVYCCKNRECRFFKLWFLRVEKDTLGVEANRKAHEACVGSGPMILFVSTLKVKGGPTRHSSNLTHFPWYSQQPTSIVGHTDSRQRSKMVSSEDLEKTPNWRLRNDHNALREGERMSVDPLKATSNYLSKNVHLTHSKSPPSSWASSEFAARSSKDMPSQEGYNPESEGYKDQGWLAGGIGKQDICVKTRYQITRCEVGAMAMACWGTAVLKPNTADDWLVQRSEEQYPAFHFSGPLIDKNIDLEDFPDQFKTLMKGITTFMKYLSEFPEFTDKAMNASIADGHRETGKALVLHPRYKLDYFIEANWEASWIADTHKVIWDEFDRKYKNLMDDVVIVEDGTEDGKQLTDNLLMWWKEKQATSVDVEHTFSRGCLLMSHIHNKLTAQTLCALMCLGQWSLYGFVNNSDIQDVSKLPDLPEADCKDDNFLMPKGWDKLQEIMIRKRIKVTILVRSQLVSSRYPEYSSARKVLAARASDVTSYTEEIFHNKVIYNGKVHPGTSTCIRKILLAVLGKSLKAGLV